MLGSNQSRLIHVHEEVHNLLSNSDLLNPAFETTLSCFGRQLREISCLADEMAAYIKGREQLKTGYSTARQDHLVTTNLLDFMNGKEFARGMSPELLEKTGTVHDRIFGPLKIRTLMTSVVDFTHYCVPTLEKPVSAFFHHFAPHQGGQRPALPQVKKIRTAFGDVGAYMLNIKNSISEGQAPLLVSRLEAAGSSLVETFTSRPNKIRSVPARVLAAAA